MKKRIIAIALLALFVSTQTIMAAPSFFANKVAEATSKTIVMAEELTAVSSFDVNVDDIDAMFAAADDFNTELGVMVTTGFGSTEKLAADKNPWVAFILAWAFGTLGVHRLYLGAGAGVFIGYLLTAGGCGIIAFIDWIVLLLGAIDGDISKYVGSKKFFMW